MGKSLLVVITAVVMSAAVPARAQTVLPRAGWVATASSANGGEPAANAIDGSSTSRWSSGTPQTSGQWFSLDMIRPQTFSQVTIDPASSSGDFTRGYQVFVSNDAVTWGDPVASGTGGGGVLTIAFPTQTARFVGVVQTGISTGWWSIAEINVYGPGAVPSVALTPAGWIATSTSTSSSDVPGHVFDGATATRWSSGVPQASGQTFQVDLLTAQPLTGVAMDSGSSSPSDYARTFQIFATNDPSNWGAAVATGGGTTALVQTSFAQVSARYLNIVLTGSSSSWWSIAELTIYGAGSFTPVATALPRLGWTASASVSCSSSATPAQALDDNASTRFSTCQNQASGQTFVVDMQVPRALTKITIDAGTFNGDFARAYQVYVSNDGVSFGAPVATGKGATQVITVAVPPQTARFVEIVQTGAASSNWWSIAELNVYGLPPVELLREGWVASASTGASAAAAIDGNLSTRWTTNAPQANGQWFELDLRALQNFNQIVLDATGASSDYPRAYQVYVSNDGVSFGAAIASGAASAAVVSIGFPDQTARYLRVVQTGSSSSWWSAFEVNVYASPTVVQIQSYIDRAYYATSDVVTSFVFQGQQVDCIPFAAQHSVKAWLAQGVAMPTTIPAAPAHRPGAPPPNLPSSLSFSGQPDVNGHPSQCPSGTVPLSRPTVAQIQAAGGVAAYKQSIIPRTKPLGSRQGVENDCWLNGSATPGGPLLPGDGSTIGSRNATDYDHAVGIQNSGWQPAGAPGFYGMSMTTPVYQPTVVMNNTFLNTGLEHTDSQLWVQTGTCDNEYNPIGDFAFGEARNQCRLGSACTTCTGAACANCAVQSLEVVSLTEEGVSSNGMPNGVNQTQLQVFITSDGYYSAYCFAGTGACTGCPSTPGPAGEGSDCFVALPQAPFKPNQPLTPNGGLGAAQYGIAPQEITFSVWNGASSGMPGWWVYVNDDPIGWYPPQAFNWPDGSPGPLGNGVATYAQAGGEVYDTWPGGKHTDTAMVSDNAATSGFKYAAYARNVEYYDAAKTPHDASLMYLVPPASEGDANIPGLCGLQSGAWTDAASAAGAYSLSTTAPAGGANWGQYFYYGGGQLSKEIAPAVPAAQPVAILYHQYAACNFVPTNPGAATTGPNAAYVLFAIEGFNNAGLGTIDFHFDPTRLFVMDPNDGLRDSAGPTPTLQLYRYIIGTDAALAQTVPRNVSEVGGGLIGYVALIVTTKATDGPSEANGINYTLAYDAQPGDPPVVLFNDSSPPPSKIGQDDCSQLGLNATVTNF